MARMQSTELLAIQACNHVNVTLRCNLSLQVDRYYETVVKLEEAVIDKTSEGESSIIPMLPTPFPTNC